MQFNSGAFTIQVQYEVSMKDYEYEEILFDMREQYDDPWGFVEEFDHDTREDELELIYNEKLLDIYDAAQ